MIKGALDADGRIAAKNAVKIRAALHQVTDFKRVFQKYQETQPQPSDNPTQDRARARSWVILNVYLNDEPLDAAIKRSWAEAYVLGQAAAGEWIAKTKEMQKADQSGIDWDNWQPGDQATALLLQPVGGFAKFLEQSGGATFFKKFDKETIENLGTALSDSIAAGLDAERAAIMIGKHVASPARALTIAITEQNRAMSFGSIQRYKEAELERMEWHVSDPCDKCAQNSGQVVVIGQSFNSGATQPPAHPHCRCVLLPVIPGMEEPTPTMADGTPMPSTSGNVVDHSPPATVKEMPFKFDPTRPNEDAINSPAKLMFKEKENRELFEAHAPGQFKEAAKQPIKIQVDPQGLKGIVQDGRMKNVHETISSRATTTKEWADKYKEMRTQYETRFIGVPSDLPASQKPIYGWLHSGGGIDSADYGSITVTLKDAVKSRTSMTAGDSLNESAPVMINKILNGSASIQDMANAGSTDYLSRYIRVVSAKWEGRVAPIPTIDTPSYWEAQVYGGVSIDDIEAISIPKSAIATRETERTKKLTSDTLSALKQAGIKVVIK